MNKKDVRKVAERIIKDYWRCLVGLAHYDKGVKQKGCDCCFCNPDKDK